jgi:MGT family glycosyltransferase
LIAAFGDPGHAFPAISLGRALAARGHQVVVETWEEWREAVEGSGLGFAAAEQYKVFPPPPPDSPEGASAAEAALALQPLLDEFEPDIVVNDILTLAPALAADRAGIKRVTLVPHIYPVTERGMPFFAVGMKLPRTPVGRAIWKAGAGMLETGLRRGREEWNEQRSRLGLPPENRLHGAQSQLLTLVATFPQLEYPRKWPAHVHVTGPLTFELPYPDVELPPGDDPLVLVAPSTSQDPHSRLIRAALDGLANEPVRVLATTNRVRPMRPIEVPDNARLVEWLSYSQILPLASLVICHGGHGTVARCLGAGVPVLLCPAAGDMAETAVRVDWAGVGRAVPWRLVGPASLRWAVRSMLGDDGLQARASDIASWSAIHDGPSRAAELIEQVA